MTVMQAVVAAAALLIAPLAIAGLALMNTGLCRARNAAHAMMSALCGSAAAVVAYFICGRAIQGALGQPAIVFTAAGHAWDWAGALPWFFRGVRPGEVAISPVLLAGWMGMIAAAIAGLVPAGSGTGRWRMGAVCASSGLLAGVTFPLFAHWSWGGGWLAQIGYLDPGGSGTIHAVGGLTALAVVWTLGPRRGKYGPEGIPLAMPGHDSVLVLGGGLVALAGWLGVNSAGAILFGGSGIGGVALAGVNTILSAAGAAAAAAVTTRVRYTKPDASLTANGWTGGLVASGASAAFVPPAAALLIGLVAGALVALSVELLDLRLEVDDPAGAISVHAIGGLWGVLAVGLFGPNGHALAQVVGMATLIGFILPFSYGLNALLNLVMPQRVPPEAEHQGLDLYELGAGAYPEFMTHNDDFFQR